jgi:3-oxoacyl-[acyl-carrier protein] reductase
MGQFTSALNGKVGIITGGTSGFGYEIVKGLLCQGAKLAVFSIDQLPENSKKELEAIDRAEYRCYEKDIMAGGASEEIVDDTVKEFGTLDFVIINAGLAIRFEDPLLETPIDHIIKSMRNQFEMFTICFTALSLAAAKVMAPKYRNIPFDDNGHRIDSGSIIVTLSEATLCQLRDDLLAYGSAKKATQWAMRTMAAVLGPKNIRVNGIAPGFANTAGPQKFYSRFPKIKTDIEQMSYLKPSFMHPGSVLPAINYLLTDNYVTGETIALDGGYNIHISNYFQEES